MRNTKPKIKNNCLPLSFLRKQEPTRVFAAANAGIQQGKKEGRRQLTADSCHLTTVFDLP